MIVFIYLWNTYCWILSIWVYVPKIYFSIHCSACKYKRITWVKFYCCKTIWNFNRKIRFLWIKFSPKNTPSSDSTVMFTPGIMIRFSISYCNSRPIATPCYTNNLIMIITSLCRTSFWFASITTWCRCRSSPIIIIFSRCRNTSIGFLLA